MCYRVCYNVCYRVKEGLMTIPKCREFNNNTDNYEVASIGRTQVMDQPLSVYERKLRLDWVLWEIEDKCESIGVKLSEVFPSINPDRNLQGCAYELLPLQHKIQCGLDVLGMSEIRFESGLIEYINRLWSY